MAAANRGGSLAGVTENTADRLCYARTPSQMAIAEIELAPHETAELTELATEAARHGARRLCVYSMADLSGVGFERREGYRRLTADDVPAGDPLPVIDPVTVRDVWPEAFHGQWGHHLVEPADYDAIPGAVFLGLPDGGERWLGICRVELGRRHIDGPGFLGWPGDTAARQALVLAAGALVGGGPATLETWGDLAEPYLAVGYQVAEECPGWELPLPN
jgi:hypothetical protein